MAFTVNSSESQILINSGLANSPRLSVRNFSKEPYTEIHILRIDVIIVWEFLLAANADAESRV